MNETLIANWNDVVGHDDTVMILGDLVMGTIAETLPLISRLNGHKSLIAGNHDRWWGLMGATEPKKVAKWERWSVAYEDVGLELVTDKWVDERISGNHLVRMCHFPYVGDHTEEDRYVEERPPDDGLILLHGHVHDGWKVNGRQINVGVDVHDYHPVAESDIVRLIEQIV